MFNKGKEKTLLVSTEYIIFTSHAVTNLKVMYSEEIESEEMDNNNCPQSV